MPGEERRHRVRVRVMRSSRFWRWKLVAAIVLAVAVIFISATMVPRWLGSMGDGAGSSPGGGGGDGGSDSGSH